jgi:ATP-dependent RNA helicase DHX36
VVKWDGESPFELAVATVEGDGPTQTEEELLNQYQVMHDDETVDNFLLLEIVQYIVKSSYGDGGILIFFSGWNEISEFSLLLESTAPFRDRSKFLILPLHSGIPSKDQRRVLQRPPQGVRKIVLSTNSKLQRSRLCSNTEYVTSIFVGDLTKPHFIVFLYSVAETSLTIDDISFVVDTGRSKEKNYDPHLKTSTLQPTWISQASAKQRKGRAGRVKAGVCFRLFSSRRHQDMKPFTESELLRTPLEEMCLMCKKLELAPGGPEDDNGIPAFLGKAMSAPHLKSVSNALELLVDLGAMQPETNDLTALGECLAVLSLEPRVGKMVIWSYLLGCVRVASDMAVAMSYKSPFNLPQESQRRAADAAKVQLSKNSESDQVTIHNVLEMRKQFKHTEQ